MLLEICVDSLASARAAIRGRADRLELCNALSVGGLSPYVELLQQIREESDIPVRCLIRPRAGDFLYTAEEIELMRRQMAALKEAGASGFVIGCLTAEGELDADSMKPLVDSAGGLPLTLHRCMDVSRDPVETYKEAAKLGFDTVLTSGAAVSCLQGEETIGRLLQLQKELGGPEIMIGAGVNVNVIRHFRSKYPQAQAFHMSGKTTLDSGMRFRRDGVPMGLPGLDEWHIQQTDLTAVQAARMALDGKI